MDAFTTAATELETAAAMYRDVAKDADVAATEAAMLSGTARSQAARANNQAARIRELIG